MATKQQFNSFEDMLTNSNVPVLVDFYAEWCGPCQMMSPILQQVNTMLAGKIKIAKINTDNYPELATKYGVYALPTLVLFKNGQDVHRIEGVMQAPQLVQQLQTLL
jgi:thioredoxin